MRFIHILEFSISSFSWPLIRAQNISSSRQNQTLNNQTISSPKFCSPKPLFQSTDLQLSMAEGEEIHTETVQSSIPTGRVKRIMKLDKDINKINADALFLISNATELFVKFLAEKSSEVAVEKKRKTIKLEHLRIAVKRHQPTADFLLDSLPLPPPPAAAQTSSKPDRPHKRSDNNPVPVGTRRIDSFFQKEP